MKLLLHICRKALFSVPILTIAWGGKGWKLRRRSRASVYSRWFVVVQREMRRWLLLQSAPPKRLDIAVLIQLARAEVCLQSKDDVVMTVQQWSVWAGVGFCSSP